MVTPETAPLVKHLKSDLERIVNSANDDLKNIRCAGLMDATRQAEEARVINEARAYAVRRVESAVRHVHNLRAPAQVQRRAVGEVEESENTARFRIAAPKPEPIVEEPVPEPIVHGQVDVLPGSELSSPTAPHAPALPPNPPPPARSRHRLEPDDEWPEPIAAEPISAEPIAAKPIAPQPVTPEPVASPQPDPEPDSPATEPTAVVVPDSTPSRAFDSDDTEVLADLPALLREMEAAATPAAPPSPPVAPSPVSDDSELTQVLPAVVPVEPQPPAESETQRLQRLLKFVARQEPGLRWAVGIRDDGSTLLVSDLAYGWVPSGIDLPDGVELLAPARRSGNAAKLLGNTTQLVTYAPGDPLGWANDGETTVSSSKPRALPAIDDLGWLLGEATHWRDGLPRMVNTLAKAAAAGTGIVDAEIDILRVYLDTARYQILAQYPDVDDGLLLNCLLLAATEALAVGDTVAATYHFAWFQTLSAPPASGWKP